LGEAPTSFPKQFLMFPTHAFVATAQYCSGAYISKGMTNKNKKKSCPKNFFHSNG
jgi:hypothetical protein